MSRYPRSPQVNSLIAHFVDRITRAVEVEIEARADALAHQMLQSLPVEPPLGRQPKPDHDRSAVARRARRSVDRAQSVLADGAAEFDTARRRLKPRIAHNERSPGAPRTGNRPGARLQAPAIDPAHAQRDAELARLRAILQPAHDEPPPARSAPAEVAIASPRPDEPPDALKVLEGEIRAQVHSLPDLPHERRAARIATWVGRARLEERTGTPDRKNVAAMMLLEKLRALAREMDVGMIEALTPSWSPPSWQRYIHMNESAAEAPAPAPVPTPIPPEADTTPPGGTGDAPERSEEYGRVWP